MNNQFKRSPNWNKNTKLVFSIVIILFIAILLIRFSGLIAPFVIALVFAAVLRPLANILNEDFKVSWIWAVNIVYLFTTVLIITLMTLGGLSLLTQIQALITFLQKALTDLPGILAQISNQSYKIGPFLIDFTKINWTEISNQLVGMIQPILSNLGGFIASLAGGAIQVAGTFFLSLMLSYIIVAETSKLHNKIFLINIPDYQDDLIRLGAELNLIWNTFFRGQAIIFFARSLITIAMLGILGVHYFIGLGIVAGIANLIPYIGSLISLVIFFIVAFFQSTTIFGLSPVAYALVIVVIAWLVENIYDSVIVPKIMGGRLKLDTVVIMVVSLLGLDMFGLMGMILAPPVLATVILLYRYLQNKMQDLDAWQEEEIMLPAKKRMSFIQQIGNRFSPLKTQKGNKKSITVSKRSKND